MKIDKKVLTIILLSLIFFTGCKKDKKESSFNNYFKYDGEIYRIDQGFLENYGSLNAGESYKLSLTLTSDGLTPIENNGDLIGITGNGHIIHFEMFSGSGTQLTDGTYQYDFSSQNAGSFDDGWISINYDASQNEAEIDQDIEEGTVIITKTGDIYEITVSCTDEDNKSVTGYFKGTLKYYNKESTYENYIMYDGQMYPMDQGVLENFGKWEVDEDYNLDLYLFSNGLKIVEDNGVWIEEIGKGHMIYFEMYASSSTQLVNGTYHYDDSYSYLAPTFAYGEILIDYDADQYTFGIYKYIEGGTISVSKSGDVYEITINCTDEDGKTLTGYYKGILKYYDYDKKKSTRAEKRRSRF